MLPLEFNAARTHSRLCVTFNFTLARSTSLSKNPVKGRKGCCSLSQLISGQRQRRHLESVVSQSQGRMRQTANHSKREDLPLHFQSWPITRSNAAVGNAAVKRRRR
ncbi:uncharacterized protein LOC144075797 [Stigmatopora argus]